MKKRVMLVIWGLLPIYSGAYLYKDKEVYVLRKWSSERQRYRYWVGFCDFHDKTHKANQIQRKKIEELLAQRNPDLFHVQVEDLSSPNDEGKAGFGSFYINSHAGILAGLATFCRDHDIPVQNVEYRYCRVISLGPVISNIAMDATLFPSTKRILVTHLLQEIEQTYTQLWMNNENTLFRTLLRQHFQEIMHYAKKVGLTGSQHTSVAEYINSFTLPAQRLDMVKNMLTFDGILIGFKLVDGVVKLPEKDLIVSFAGGTHIAQEFVLLQKIDGWEPLHKMEHSGSKGSASVLEGIAAPTFGYNTKPAPLSVELIEHYLKN